MSGSLTEEERLAEAALWQTRLTEMGVDSTVDFETWREDPANASAWEAVEGPWRRMGELAAAPQMLAARAGALERARQARSRKSGRPGLVRLALIAASLIGLAIMLAFFAAHFILPSVQDFTTGLGERRVVRLADGSSVSLDSATQLQVRYTRGERALTLVSGQARFEVAHDTSRPFTVRAGDQTVVATGTVFNVEKLGAEVLVTLIEGRVTVRDVPPGRGTVRNAPTGRPTPPASVVLTPGEQVAVGEQAASAVKWVNAAQVTAWESGQLVFENESLSAAAARMARYSGKPVVVTPDVAGLKMSGVFRAGDVTTFVDAVSAYLPVETSADEQGGIVLRARS